MKQLHLFGFHLLIAYFGFFMTISANAHRVRNGGDGVWVNGKLRLLDLVEAGVDEAPRFNDSIPIDNSIQKRVHKALVDFPQEAEWVSQKLSELYQFSPGVATAIAFGLSLYDFRLVDHDLIDVLDEENVFHIDQKDKVQLAIRFGNTIFIAKNTWLLLTEQHRAALILHEIIYAFTRSDFKVSRPDLRVDPDELIDSQSSVVARGFNGFLFTDAFLRGDPGKLSSHLKTSQLELIRGSAPIYRETEQGELLIHFLPQVKLTLNPKNYTDFSLQTQVVQGHVVGVKYDEKAGHLLVTRHGE